MIIQPVGWSHGVVVLIGQEDHIADLEYDCSAIPTWAASKFYLTKSRMFYILPVMSSARGASSL